MLQRLVLASLLLSAGLSAQVTVVNAASFAPGAPITAGSWAAAFGTFNGVSTTTASLPFPKTLAGVKVTIEGVDSPLFDVRSTQITFLIPAAITPGLHPIVVTTPAGTVNGSVRVVTSAPGLFMKDTATPPKGAVLNSSGIENSASNPATRGDFVSVYGTGPGAFKLPIADGEAPGGTLNNTSSTPQVFISGVPATVQFSGLNPASPGLWQINVFIPNESFIKGHVPLQIFVDGVASNEVGIFVQ
ncbi:MAG TPA: hypothetical protein VHC72_17655 [Bryobacteraceae bacterium]|nr:hypothetical protein [Bryobacteraceae bacterium]